MVSLRTVRRGIKLEMVSLHSRTEGVTPPFSASPRWMGRVTPPPPGVSPQVGGVTPPLSVISPGMGEERDEMRGVDINEGVPKTTLRPRENSTFKIAEVSRYLLPSCSLPTTYILNSAVCMLVTCPIENGFLR